MGQNKSQRLTSVNVVTSLRCKMFPAARAEATASLGRGIAGASEAKQGWLWEPCKRVAMGRMGKFASGET